MTSSTIPPANAPGAVRLTIDGVVLEVPTGTSVLDAIALGGAHVPHLCKDPDQPAIGACRTCLVEVEGVRGLPASCSLPATEGLVVRTTGERLDRVRATVLDLTMGMVDPAGRGAAVLAEEVARYGSGARAGSVRDGTRARFAPRPEFARDDSTPAFVLNHADCILCGRCAQGCQDIQHIGAIAVLGGGESARIGTFLDRPLVDSICTSCGTCVAACPTQALLPTELLVRRDERAAQAPPTVSREVVTREVVTTCAYCGVGCGVALHVDEADRIVLVDDRPGNPSSQGMLCVKGRFGLTFVNHEDRLRTPLIRRNGILEEASWDEALDLVADKLVEHRGSFAALASAKATNEDAYVLQKFVRTLMRTNNLDHCTRLCHSPSVEAMLQQLGSGATSNSYEDYDNAGCLVVVGTDTGANHPVIASRLRRAIDERGARLIVINPRRIDLCDYATLFLQPHPGTDVALFNGLAKVVLDESLADVAFIEARTEGFEAFAASLAEYTPERVEEITGVPASDLRAAARLYAQPPFSGSCLIWGMGVTQHTCGTDNAHALLNLALIAGQIGKPGSGVSPLRGQNNVQGCGDSGCLPDSLPGYQGLGDVNRAKFEAAWGVEVPSERGLRATEMFEVAAEGGLAAMYVTGENPLLSEPYIAHTEEAIERLEFLVVQDIFPNETTAHAHVVLPATSFAEKDGTFTNSERRVQRVRQAIAPIGDSRPDWWITSELARRVGKRLGGEAERRALEGFAWQHPREIFAELASLTPILAGVSYDSLETDEGVQWPCPEPDHPGTKRLYEQTFAVGRAPFVPVEQGPPAAELPSRRFPLILNTGRILYHWHGGTITTRARVLLERSPALPVAIHPRDASKAGIEDGEPVAVYSRRGDLTGVAVVTDAMRPGEIFVPFVRLGESSANFLTNNVYDPQSRIPEYKVCAVRIEKPGAPGSWRRQRRGRRGASAERGPAGP